MPTFKELTTFKVGGPIAGVVRPGTKEEFVAAVVEKKEEEFLILGSGSNVLAKDEPYAGTVIIPTFDAVEYQEGEGGIFISAEAGATWDTVVAGAVERGWWGLENLSGIPGTVGAAPIQNIGAYGAAFSESVVAVAVYDRTRASYQTLTREQCLFGYRDSIFKKEPGRYLVLNVTFVMSKVPYPRLAYRDLAAIFPTGAATLDEIRAAVLGIRARKFPDLAQYGTAGSFFTNPIISKHDVAHIEKEFPDMPLFVLPEGGIKIPLAWILDHVIDAKRLRVGGAFVWHEQALVIATENGATASDVRALAEIITKRVEKETTIQIIPEVLVM